MTICWVNVCIIESYVHAFISCWVGYLYLVTTIRILCIQWRWLEYFVFSYDDYDTVIASDDNWYHMHIESCLKRITYIWLMAKSVILDYVLGETWWFMYLVKFGEYVKMWNCACCSIVLVFLMFYNDVEFIVNDLIKCLLTFR